MRSCPGRGSAAECAHVIGPNNRRLLAPLGNIPPAEAEERFYAMLGDTPMAA